MLIQKNLSDYINRDIKCSCGKNHRCNVKDIILGKNVLGQLVTLLHKYRKIRPLIVCDENTFEVCGKLVEDIFVKNSVEYYEKFVFPTRSLVADMEACLTLERNLSEDCDIIIAVGSGTINDICRYVSFRKGIPYIICATAPSMDGFASDVSPLIVDNLKTTYSAVVPMAIVGDVNILKDAPLEMIAAGAGDILGKYTCLCDWMLSHIITGEYYCEEIAGLIRHSIEVVANSCRNIANDRESAVISIMEGLILSGVAMAYALNSRPASGSEHHLSHYFEMMFLFDGKKAILHGTKVGLATVLVLKLYKKLLNDGFDYDNAKSRLEMYDLHAWEEEMKEYYRAAAGGVLKLEQEIGKNNPEVIKKRLTVIKEHEEEIRKLIDALPSPEVVEDLLKSMDAPYLPSQVGVSDEEVRRAVICAKELRNRYGLLQLLYDLGVIREYADYAVTQS